MSWIYLIAGGVSAYGKDTASIDDLFKKGVKVDVKTLAKEAKKVPAESRDIYNAVGLELYEYYKEQIEFLEPIIAENRKHAQENPALACMLAYAYASENKPESSAKLLDLISSLEDDELTQAEIQVVTGHLKLTRFRLEAASESLALAKKHYKSAVSGPEYVTWHSRLIERRIKSLEEALKKPKSEAKPESPLTAWLAADKAGAAAAYAKIIDLYPNTIYAEASELAMARLHLKNGDPRSCLKALNASPLLEGELADHAWIAIGDALVLDGQSTSDAGEAYEQAVAAFAKQGRSKLKLDEEEKTALLPSDLLHYYTSGYPKWKPRSPGQILLTSQDPRLLAYFRYQTVVKRSALAYAEGKRSSAASLARTLLMIDPIDRKMAEDRDGPGALVLETSWSNDKFICALSSLDGAKPEIRNSILMAVGFYQVYDFESSSWWLDRVMEMKASNPKDRLAQQFAAAVKACNLSLFDRKDESLKMAKSIVLKDNQPANSPWILARQLESRLYMDLVPPDVENALRCHQEVIDRSNRIGLDIENSTIALCVLSTYYKPEAAGKYIQLFDKLFPSEDSISQSLKNDLRKQNEKRK